MIEQPAGFQLDDAFQSGEDQVGRHFFVDGVHEIDRNGRFLDRDDVDADVRVIIHVRLCDRHVAGNAVRLVVRRPDLDRDRLGTDGLFGCRLLGGFSRRCFIVARFVCGRGRRLRYGHSGRFRLHRCSRRRIATGGKYKHQSYKRDQRAKSSHGQPHFIVVPWVSGLGTASGIAQRLRSILQHRRQLGGKARGSVRRPGGGPCGHDG